MAIAKPYLPAGVPGRCWLRSDRRIFDSAPRTHVELVALFVLNGRMRYFIDDRILSLGPRTLLWAHTDQSHVLLAESADFDMWVIAVADWVLRPARLFPPRLARDLGAGAGARLLDESAASELAAVAAGLRQVTDRALLITGLKWWTARAWQAWQGADASAEVRVHPAVPRAAELLRRRPDLPLAEVARQTGSSLSHLRRVFRSATGLALVEFRTRRRLNRVDAVMARPDAPPLLAAALDAGFGSYSQFYRVFMAARGISPRRYYRRGSSDT